MRWSAVLVALVVMLGGLLLGAGFLWSGAGAPPVVARALPPGGLLTDTPTANPNETSTPLDAAVTPTPTTSPTIVATPTECLIYFVDVPPDNTFYTYVRCLSCRGIVGGYPCGGPGEPCPGQYYRPGNNVTRGQTSKIVSLAASFADPVPSSQQTFEDVSPGSTFWLYIEQLAGRGIIEGYPCGGPFEPCVAPTNRPYFRPNNNVTRGQLSKIVAGAAGYTETPPGQTFADVPPGSTFYLYVERIAARGVISGYPCGGVGEPCVAPANRPYFRPNNNATRGQMSKIAANTFFPSCYTPGPTPTPIPTNTPTPTITPCALAWRIVAGPNSGTGYQTLSSLAKVSASDVWAVGTVYNTGVNNYQTLVAHWDGSIWSVVPSPNVGTGANFLYSVAAVRASDVWALGYSDNGGSRTLVEHWNGTSWSIVPSPNSGTGTNILRGIEAVSASNIWAVGFAAGTSSSSQPLIEHWDGSNWSVVPSPNVGNGDNTLVGVVAVSANNIWAVGYSDSGGVRTLVEHWDGTNWSIVLSPNGAGDSILLDVAAVSAGDVWAVGYSASGGPPVQRTLVEHWNGTNWSVVSSPNVGTGDNDLSGLAVVSAGDIWAVGSSYNGGLHQALVAHWNGTDWSVVPSPPFGTSHNELRDVVAISVSDLWAVGNAYNNGYQTLVEHYGPCSLTQFASR